MSIENEAKEVEKGAKAVQSALDIPLVKYAVTGALGIVGVIAAIILIRILF